MDLQEEKILVEKAKTDIQSFDTLYRYYLPKVYGYCYNRLSNKALVEDIVSEVFMAALKKLPTFEYQKGAKFGSWLYSVAHNKLVDYFRKNKVRNATDLDDTIVDKSIEQDKEVELDEKQKQISFILTKLNSRYQEIISLKFYSEFTNIEIAEHMRTDNVAVILHRALKSFKSKFKKYYPESEIYDLF